MFISNGYKLSKGKKPCGDSFFSSKLGLGVADGVGGWCQYGIDPSLFSQQLMNECKRIIKIKEQDFFDNVQKSLKHIPLPLDDEHESDKHKSSSKDYSGINKAFGAPVRETKMKRIRSSFHLDEYKLRECHQDRTASPNDEMSPISNSNGIEGTPKAFCVRIEPRIIIKQAFKGVEAFGSSTACV
jgi:hypothetical protein